MPLNRKIAYLSAGKIATKPIIFEVRKRFLASRGCVGGLFLLAMSNS